MQPNGVNRFGSFSGATAQAGFDSPEVAPNGSTGLYHVANLYPARALLADAVRRVLAAGIALKAQPWLPSHQARAGGN